MPPPLTSTTTSIANTNNNNNSTTAAAVGDSIKEEHAEKPPIIIEEQTQEHQYESPPEQMQELLEKKATIKDTRPMIINSPDSISDPTLIPVAELPIEKQQAVLAEAGGVPAATEPEQGKGAIGDLTSASTSTSNTATEQQTREEETWPILIRSASNGTQTEKQVDIPITAPFMTVSQLKTEIQLEPHQQVKLIYLGRILKDDFTLVPASCAAPDNTKNKKKKENDIIKLVNKSVIQAMIYNK